MCHTSDQLIIFLKEYLSGFYNHVSKLKDFWKKEIINKILMISVLDVGNASIDLSNGQF